ncbi:MAG: ATP-binding protein [Bacteroidia bacterium]
MPKLINNTLNRIRKVFFVTIVVILLLSIFSGVKIRNMMNIESAVKEAQQTNEALSKLQVILSDAGGGLRDYLITKDTMCLRPLGSYKKNLEAELLNVRRVLSGNVRQLSNLAELKMFIDKRTEWMNTVRAKGSCTTDELLKGKAYMGKVKLKIEEMEALEKKVLAEKENNFSEYLFLTPALWYTLIALCILIIAFSFITIRKELRHSVKLQEQRLQQNHFMSTLIDSSFDIIISFDKDIRINMMNRRAEEFYKMHRDDVIGRLYTEIFPQAVGGETHQNIKKALKGETIFVPKITATVGEGVFEQFYVPLKNEQGETAGILVYAHEITATIEAETQLKKLNQELTQKNSELELKNHELASFAYISSHDLQEPLRKIQSFADLITNSEKDNLSEGGKDYFSRMQKAASRMQALINDLLAYSRAGTTERIFEQVDLNALIEDIRSELKENLTEKGAVIETEQLPKVSVVRFQFHQLFTNLISNSLKFSKTTEPPLIRITSELVSALPPDLPQLKASGSYLRLSLTDNGIGFEPQYNKSIFELFQRLHGRSEYSGTGIGLAICKKIIDNHHGAITASGQAGIGARFDIYLPV